MEFQVDFQGGSSRYLVLKYEFAASSAGVLAQLSEANLSSLLANDAVPQADALCHPSCTAEIIHITEYGFPFKVRSGSAGMLSITEL